MKRLIILFILFVPIISALQITEVELNPLGTDTGQEWFEIYSNEEINLSDYTFVNNDLDEIKIDEKIKGYFVYVLEKQWLDNSDEKISIYLGSELIFETPLFEDSRNDENTFSLCDSKWVFQKETKGEENCNVKEESDEKLNEEISEKEEEVEKIDKKAEEKITNFSKTPVVTENKVINLNPKTIKKDEDSTKLEKSYVKYSIVGFGTILAGRYLFKPKEKKNEFR